MSTNQIDYHQLTTEALRSIVRRVLVQTASEGLPGNHHFFLTFDTTHSEVEISPQARNLYPREMTIVLQHQFWDLVVDEESFAVTLRFGGAKQRVRVPFEALRTFVDPAAEFGLDLTSADEAEVESEEIDAEETGAERTETGAPSVQGADRGGDVVPIDRFRRDPS